MAKKEASEKPGAKSPEAIEAAMVANLPATTGRALEEWLRVVAKDKLTKHGEIVAMLKGEHGIGHGYANLIAHRALKSSASAAEDPAELVEAQYAGAKAPLRPIYDSLIGAMAGFGPDVEASPKKAYVSMRRNKQFAIVQPSTATRLDVGINLKGHPTTARLEASGSFNSMVSHRVRLSAAKDVDAELIGWLRRAYDAS